MSRLTLPSDLLPGDIFGQLAAMLSTLAAGDPERMACEAILAGESLIRPRPDLFHIGMVVGPADGTVIEELPTGQTKDRENLCSAWYNIWRIDALTADQRAAVVARMASRLGQRYGFADFVIIGGMRVLHLPLTHPAYTDPAVCSSAVAIALAENGIFPWKSRGIDPSIVVPSDYPGDGMRLISAAGVFVGEAA